MSERLGRGDLGGFHKDSADVILTAQDLGWSCRKTASGAVRMTAPDGTTMNVPHSTKQSGNVQSMRRKVLKHADPGRLVAVGAIVEGAEVRLDADLPSGPHVVEERPFLSRLAPGKDGGTRYESPVILERVWSDGTVDYLCRVCRTFTSPNHRSVAVHAGKAHQGEYQPVSGRDRYESAVSDLSYTAPVGPTRQTAYRPSDRLVEALAEYLREQVTSKGGPIDVDAIAEAALAWMHDRPDLERGLTEPRELTAEETLDRIRLLVDRGEVVRLRQQVDGLHAEVEAATKAADRAKAALRTFADLAAEEAAAEG